MPLNVSPISQIAAIDFEASSLWMDFSFPVEFGGCDISMDPKSHLIRPTEYWASEEWMSTAWDPASERIHGLSFERLMDEGLDVRTSAECILEAYADKFLVSDNPAFDAIWLSRLFQAAAMEQDCPKLYCPHRCVLAIEFGESVDETCMIEYGDNEFDPVIRDWSIFNHCDDLVRGSHPKPHRAGADALFVMALTRAQVDTCFREDLSASILAKK